MFFVWPLDWAGHDVPQVFLTLVRSTVVHIESEFKAEMVGWYESYIP